MMSAVGDDNRKLSLPLEEDALQKTEYGPSQEPVDNREEAQNEEPTDWRDLTMLAKLDSMYLLTEWQFHNPMRLRFLMKADDETVHWVSHPVVDCQIAVLMLCHMPSPANRTYRV
jgi:hypothetical protein